jgi:hypothetical protein
MAAGEGGGAPHGVTGQGIAATRPQPGLNPSVMEPGGQRDAIAAYDGHL